MFSQVQNKRIDQREDLATSNRLPRFRIRACSGPIFARDGRKPRLGLPFLGSRFGAQGSDRFLATVTIPTHLSWVPPQRLLTRGTLIILDSSRLSSPEYQIAEQKADARADRDSDESEDECWRDGAVCELLGRAGGLGCS
jgi:hypothetical protein